MHGTSPTSIRRQTRRVVALLALSTLLAGAQCQNNAQIDPHDAEMAEFIRMMMPVQIEIQRYLTKPRDYDGDANHDGVEVVLAALDSFGDPVKCVGSFQFELHELRVASGDKLGKRVALWNVSIDSAKTLVEHWDRLSGFYSFPLQLSSGTLPAGRYVLTARLRIPSDKRLSDEYEFQCP